MEKRKGRHNNDTERAIHGALIDAHLISGGVMTRRRTDEASRCINETRVIRLKQNATLFESLRNAIITLFKGANVDRLPSRMCTMAWAAGADEGEHT